jgi:Glyoxalase-like domain
MSASISWVTAMLDSPPETAAAAEVFWAALTGSTLSHRRGDRAEFATLLPTEGDPFLKVQEVVQSVPGAMHLDLYTEDVAGLATRAEELGATASYSERGFVVCGSPGALTFCVVGHHSTARPPAQHWPTGRSLVDQVCLDIPPGWWHAEVAFWEALTGWPRVPAGDFDRLVRPPGIPLAFLLQRLDDEQPTVTAHLDLACDDRDAETARQAGLGAEVVRRMPGWTVMRDPAGRFYCNTGRRPGVV